MSGASRAERRPRARSRPAAPWLLAALLAWNALGCVTGLDLSELPPDPIAITYWEPEPARRRAEIISRRESGRAAREPQLGVARVGDIGRLLGGASDTVWNADLRRFPGRLTLLDPRTGRLTPVPEVPPGAIPLAWSADHRRLLYMSNHRGPVQLYEYDTQVREVRQVTHGNYQHLWGDYGVGRQLTALEVGVEDEQVFARILVTDEEGREPRVVVDEGMLEHMRLAPDGRTLVYVRQPEPERPEMVAVDLETGAEHVLGPGHEPAFSRQGDWIVYSARSRDGWRLRRIRRDGSARSSGGGAGIRDEKMPSVSPDGRFVVYVGPSLASPGVDRLFVRRMDGSGDRILLDDGAAFSPAW